MYGHIRNVAKHGIRAFFFLRKRPGLTLLVILLCIITLGIVKPEFYLMGWDNFSSYLNLKSSLYNTVFATWREHRGLGVPSDAEINDLPRQLFSIFASLFVRKELIDQLYVTLMLWGGVLSMYALGRYVSSLLKQRESERELFGSIAALFYLFNLNTLAVFYFPMIMYITRFFMLPTTTLVLLRFIHGPRMTRRAYLLSVAALFVGFGSFMVPTIWIVLLAAVGLMVLIFKNKVRVLTALVFIIGLGMYWMLPFANYTMQKGDIVPQAPLFIDINEAMLNKPKSFYSFSLQAKLRPSFFESQFTNNAKSFDQPFHELAGHDETGFASYVLWIFPAIYLLGASYILLFKRDRILIWFAAMTLIFLIISMKEYSPFGLLYGFISDHMPFANTVFRFGDTKFHAMIAFGGSIVSAVFIVRLVQVAFQIRGNRVIKNVALFSVLSGLIILHTIVYKSYFTGNFVGFFMYNKIPTAYFEIANIINQEPEAIRVIHLPFDRRGYWKPYTWGYFGSSFLHFMLNKPLFDRTFEPASMENAQVHEQLMDIVHMTSAVSSDAHLDERARNLYDMLHGLSIKYIIDDGTISTNIVARNIAYWGVINPIDTNRLLEYLEQKGLLKLVKQYTVTPQDYVRSYATLYPYNKQVATDASMERSIRLYELTSTAPRVQLVSQAEKVHTSHNSLLSPRITRSLTSHYIQSKEYDDESLVFPFAPMQSTVQRTNDQIRLSLPIRYPSSTYVLESTKATNVFPTYLVNVYLQKMGTFIRVSFEHPVYPTIEHATNQNPQIFTSLDLEGEPDDPMHLRVGDSVLRIEDKIDQRPQFIGSVIMHSSSAPVSLLYRADTYDVSTTLVQREPNPQCENDALENAASHITGDLGILTITGGNVSNCLTTEVSLGKGGTARSIDFAQLVFDTKGTSKSLSQKKYLDSSKPKLTGYVDELKNPLAMHVCIRPTGSSVCINKDSLFRITEEKKNYTIPIIGNLSSMSKLLITFTVRSSLQQTYDTTTTNILLKTFTSGSPKLLTITQAEEHSATYALGSDSNLNLILPIAKSDYSQIINFHDDATLIGRDPSCDEPGKYRAIKDDNSGILLYAVGCKNFVNRNIPFSSNNFYLWYASYKHLSGAIPSFIVMDKIDTYTYKKLIPTGVNADTYFSRPFQKPESLFTSAQSISERISKTPMYTVRGFIDPRFDVLDSGNNELIIEHFSQNEGVIQLNTLSLIELPNVWLNSKLYKAGYQPVTYETQAKLTSYVSLLPSLRQVKVTAENEGEYLLWFNEQYDDQWLALNVQALLHARCDGYANCYRVKLPRGSSTIYLFYVPEILSLFGLGITTLTILLGYTYVKLGN